MINYVMPKYCAGIGDCCIVNDSVGDKVIEKKMTSVLKGIYKDRCLDINYLRKRISKIVNQKHLIPIYLSEGEVLIPIKVRSPKVSTDGGYGLLNIYFIEKVEKNDVVLKNGKRINFLDNKRSIIRRIQMSETLEENFNDKTLDMPEVKDKQLVWAIKYLIVTVMKKIVNK